MNETNFLTEQNKTQQILIIGKSKNQLKQL